MKKFFYLMILFMFCGLDVFAMSLREASVQVDLFPAGSFEMTGRVTGAVIKTGNQQYSAENLKFSLRSLETGKPLRNKHTKEKLQYKKYPYIIVPKAIGRNGEGQAFIEINGIRKKIPFTYKEGGDHVLASFDLDLKAFGIEGVNYMGVGVQDKVNVAAKIPVKKR